jgi:hypothetical protein
VTPTPTPAPTEAPDEPAVSTVRAPRELHTNLVTTGEVRLAWSRASFGAAVDHFVVLRDDVKIGEAQERTFIDSTVEPSQTYVYRVVAIGVDGSRATSDAITVTTPAPPAPPTEGSGGGSAPPPGESCDGIVTPSGECIPWNA